MTDANISTQIVCRVCKESKIIDFFPKSITGKHGRTTRCVPCTNIYLKVYQGLHKERLAAAAARRYEEQKESRSIAAKINYEKNKDAYKVRAKKWSQANPGKRKEISKRYSQADPIRRYEQSKSHRLANPGMYAAHFKMRQQRIKRALSPWADLKAIESFYIESARITKETGIKHHVDHYYPLTSDIVCGLHNEFNLRVIPATENLSKANSFPEEIS